MKTKKNSKLVILTGFSGAGKDTLMNMLISRQPSISRIITHTSRPKRPGEKNGKDYHFTNKTIFEKMIKGNHLVEHVLYGSHYKGTSKKEFERVIAGESLIWRIDMSRAAIVEQVFKKHFNVKTATTLIQRTVKILIQTTSPQIALARYKKRDRKTANIKEFKNRLNKDTKIWLSHRHKFPHVVINKTGKQKEAIDQIVTLLNNR